MSPNLKIAILASGSGSNFQAIVEDIRRQQRAIEVVALVTDNPQAYAVERARELQIPVHVIDPKAFAARADFQSRLAGELQTLSPDLVVLAGFMRILGAPVLQAFRDRIINIHPSLLPAFPGLNAISQAFAAGVKVSGVTVHFVDEGMDTGPIIAQEWVPISETDTETSLEKKIHTVEHQLYPKVIGWFAAGRVSLHGRRVRIAHA